MKTPDLKDSSGKDSRLDSDSSDSDLTLRELVINKGPQTSMNQSYVIKKSWPNFLQKDARD